MDMQFVLFPKIITNEKLLSILMKLIIKDDHHTIISLDD